MDAFPIAFSFMFLLVFGIVVLGFIGTFVAIIIAAVKGGKVSRSSDRVDVHVPSAQRAEPAKICPNCGTVIPD